MSALDTNLGALLTVSVNYSKKTGTDANGQDTWAAPVALKCYPAFGSMEVQRKDGSIYTSDQSLYFDASNATVQGFQLGDRFQSVGIAGGETLEAVAIEPNYSPGPSLGAAMTAWIVEVRL